MNEKKSKRLELLRFLKKKEKRKTVSHQQGAKTSVGYIQM